MRHLTGLLSELLSKCYLARCQKVRIVIVVTVLSVFYVTERFCHLEIIRDKSVVSHLGHHCGKTLQTSGVTNIKWCRLLLLI